MWNRCLVSYKKNNVYCFVEPSVSNIEITDLPPFDENKMSEYDLVVCVGGDGTVLHANTYFQNYQSVPPTVCFGAGTLGFLTPFDPNCYQKNVWKNIIIIWK